MYELALLLIGHVFLDITTNNTILHTLIRVIYVVFLAFLHPWHFEAFGIILGL